MFPSMLIGATLAMVMTAGALGATSEASPSTTTPTLEISEANPMRGETFVVTATKRESRTRPVRLERHISGGWRVVQTQRTNTSGLARFVWRTAQPTSRLRIVAPRHRAASGVMPHWVSSTGMVNTSPQTVVLTGVRDRADNMDLTVRSSHLRSRRLVTIQTRRPGGTWEHLTSRRMVSTPVMAFPDALTAAEFADVQVRAVLSPFHRASSIASRPLIDSTVAMGARLDADGTRLVATTQGDVERVKFFVDGVAVGEDTRAPFALKVPISAGRHSLMARVWGPSGSRLSLPVEWRVPPGTVDDSGMADGFSLEVVQSGFELPTSASVAGPDLVLVAEKSGLVKALRFSSETGWGAPAPVLDLRDIVLDEQDAGLVGITVDPDFGDNGFVYLAYVLDTESDTGRQSQQIARFTWDGTRLVRDSHHVVLGRVTGPSCHLQENIRTDDCLPATGPGHTVGDLDFDRSGNLIVGVGDGALDAEPVERSFEAMRAQDSSVLAGKVLRIDPVNGRGVPGNALFDANGTSNPSRVLAMGLRNPFRFHVDGDRIIVGDVGETHFEELNILPLNGQSAAPVNFGWPCVEGADHTALADISEGAHPFHACESIRESDRLPVHAYPHAAGGGSVTAGVFLSSAGYPPGARGQFIYGDYAQNHLRSLSLREDLPPTGLQTLASARAAKGPVKIFTGPDGWVWSVSIYDGSLRRLTYRTNGQTSTCSAGTFRQRFHDLDGPGSAFDKEYPDDEWRWLYPYAEVQLPPETLGPTTCVPAPNLPATTGSPWLGAEEQDDRAHPGDRWGVSWDGRVALEGGTYRFKVRGSEWLRLSIDHDSVHDFYANDFWADQQVHEVQLSPGLHHIALEHVHGDQPVAEAALTWTRVGGPPQVEFVAPANGAVTDGQVNWRVVVGDPDGDAPETLLANTRVVADFLHFHDGDFHAHPYAGQEGADRGTFIVDDDHAPGQGVIRLRATTTDSSGARTTSLPRYVCFAQGNVGPCAD